MLLLASSVPFQSQSRLASPAGVWGGGQVATYRRYCTVQFLPLFLCLLFLILSSACSYPTCPPPPTHWPHPLFVFQSHLWQGVIIKHMLRRSSCRPRTKWLSESRPISHSSLLLQLATWLWFSAWPTRMTLRGDV